MIITQVHLVLGTVKVGLHNRRMSAQTVRNHLSEAHLRAHHPHQGLDLIAVCRRRHRLQWASAHLRWTLARWRSMLFMDESRFHLYRADGSVYGIVWVSGLLMSKV
jgi:hypothetical protein